ncbi:MAG: chloride channel protein [Bacteroidia bacterium]|nr:chloride channel protein [Bacteroidia bacterium]
MNRFKSENSDGIWSRFRHNKWVDKSIIYLKKLYDRSIESGSQWRLQALQFVPFFFASFLTGLIAFLYSRIISFTERKSMEIYEFNHALIFLITPLTFLLSWWLVVRFAPFARGSGIPQVIASIELTKSKKEDKTSLFLSVRIIIVKILSSAIKMLGGGILGREGPTIQISSSIFNVIYKRLPNWWMPIAQRNILIAGAASGLSAAFNTPLGGIIFAIEELSKFHIKYYKSSLLIAVIIAGLTAQTFGGSYLYLGYPPAKYTSKWVYVGLVLVAVVVGYFGSKMCEYMYLFMGFVAKQKTKFKQVGIIVLCGLFMATLIYFVGVNSMGSGKELMETTLFTDQKKVDWYLPFVRMSGLVATFSCGGAGGIFAPSLSIGATFGSLVAEIMGMTAGNANLLILVGMVGFLTSVTRAPFTSAIIVFEMTDRHSIIFFLFMGALIANIVSTRFNKKSFYDLLKDDYIKSVEDKVVPAVESKETNKS